MLEKNSKEIKWFEEAGLGMFIHWSLYAATEGYHNGKETEGIIEWIQSREKIPGKVYEKYAEKLNADNFDAEKIADMAKRAGMKYFVFTTKHHEGFAMFDTKYDDYSINGRCGVKRDVTRELVEAMRKRGIVPCLYYSHGVDFHEENAMGNTWDYDTPENERDFRSYLEGKCKMQIKELLTNYGEIGMLWFDVPRGVTPEIAKEIRDYVKSIQPGCLVNGRIGGGKDEWDFICMGDNEAPYGRINYPAETCATMNNTWGYKRDDKNFKSPKTIIELLCQLSSKGVNLLLNIGPKGDGSVPEESIYILEKLAEWMDVNKEAIHKTKASPFAADFSYGWMSRKENKLYIFVKDKVSQIDFTGLENDVVSAKTMSGKDVPFVKSGKTCHIDLSDVEFSDTVTVIALTVDGEIQECKGLCQQEESFVSMPCCECVVHKSAQNDGEKNFDSALDRVLGEYRDVNPEMNVNINGTVEQWFDTENYISWDAEILYPGEYKAVLYTVTGKYRKWCGEHKILLTCKDNELKKELCEDVIPRGVNRQYFAETGSILGKITIEKPGKYTFTLKACEINGNDPVGLSVTRLELIKEN